MEYRFEVFWFEVVELNVYPPDFNWCLAKFGSSPVPWRMH
jgi:hypothetical protein